MSEILDLDSRSSCMYSDVAEGAAAEAMGTWTSREPTTPLVVTAAAVVAAAKVWLNQPLRVE